MRREGQETGRESVSGPARHRRLRSVASDWNLGFRGGALHSCWESSAVEPGVGQMGTVGVRHNAVGRS